MTFLLVSLALASAVAVCLLWRRVQVLDRWADRFDSDLDALRASAVARGDHNELSRRVERHRDEGTAVVSYVRSDVAILRGRVDGIEPWVSRWAKAETRR